MAGTKSGMTSSHRTNAPTLPSGTVTFLFTDIEGSTVLLKRLGDEGYANVLEDHRRVLRTVFAAHDGQEIDTQGDAFFYSFPRARDAAVGAVEAQRGLAGADWPEGVNVKIRIGLHTGEPSVGDEGYTGLDVVRAARIAAVGHGGQILMSETTRALLGTSLPEGVSARSIGEQRLKDIDRPEPLHELTIDGITATAPVEQPPQQLFDPAGVPTDEAALDKAVEQTIQQHVLDRIQRALRDEDA
jgi:class 3 adenylate cyclase